MSLTALKVFRFGSHGCMRCLSIVLV